jgi:hypothetical protein
MVDPSIFGMLGQELEAEGMVGLTLLTLTELCQMVEEIEIDPDFVTFGIGSTAINQLATGAGGS